MRWIALALLLCAACSRGPTEDAPEPWFKAPLPLMQASAELDVPTDLCERAVRCCRNYIWSAVEMSGGNLGQMNPDEICDTLAQALDSPARSPELCANLHESLMSAYRQLEPEAAPDC